MLTTFGFSAYLKLVSLNPKPQRSEIKKRVRSGGRGYDFHKRLRSKVRQLLVENIPSEDIILSVEDIVPLPEKKSIKAGLENFLSWRKMNDGKIVSFSPVIYESPSKIFGVRFTPDFGIYIDDRAIAVHVWNNKTPPLQPRNVFAALSLFSNAYANDEPKPDDLALLSLSGPILYRLSGFHGQPDVSAAFARHIESVFNNVRDELRLPPSDRREYPDGPLPPI